MIEKKLFFEIDKNAEFHSVVMTTFSFDFHHFESQVLKQIKGKGVTNVCIFADAALLDESIGFATGNLRNISSSYSINGIEAKGAFHPKLTLFVGENEAMLLQGSGNITSGGHGKNHELFSVLYATEDDKTQLPLIIEAWQYIKSLTVTVKGLSSEKLDWIENHTTLFQERKKEKHIFHQLSENFESALLYNEKTGILKQLKGLIPNNKVKRIKVVSPFYDENGALLLALSNHYGNCPIEAYLQENKGIHPHQMASQKNINFYSWDSADRAEKTFKKYNRKLHAKLFIFETEEWNYCLIGSANASLAAFGNDGTAGANAEFSILYKYKNRNFDEELGIVGKKQKIIPTKPTETEKQNDSDTKVARNQKIKILGADKEGRTVTLHLQNFTQHNHVKIIFYDYWGIAVEEQRISNLADKIKLELSKTTIPNGVAFIQLFSEFDAPVSNKQLLNNVADLWNTNPSPENRKIMKLTSMIEAGESKLFDVMEYFNTIHSSRSAVVDVPSGNSNIAQKGPRITSDAENTVSYEDAIILDNSNKSHQRILKQHHSVKIWDSFEKYARDYIQRVEEDNMDDEEEGNATSSRVRKEATKEKKTAKYSIQVLNTKREIIYKFLKNYKIALSKAQEIENKKIGLVDLAMLLIVLKQLHDVTHRKFIAKNVNDDENSFQNIYQIQGNLGDIDSLSGASLNLLGKFINITLNSTWDKPEDEYTQKKLDHYKNIASITSLFSLAIIKNSYAEDIRFADWFDVTAYNIVKVLGKPNDGFEKSIENLINDSHIEELSNVEINKIITSWITKYETKQYKDYYFENETTGICIVDKFIPPDKPKFLKLSRPGFDYIEETHRFISDKLFDLKANSWFNPNPRKLDEL